MTGFLFGLLFLLFLANAPIAVAIGAATLAAFFFKGDVNLMLVVQRMYAGADSFPLMAVPLFMMAGVIMERGGVSRRIIGFADALVGWLPGGLAAVSVVSAMFFAGISGSAAADTAAVGGILIPSMIKRRYDRNFVAAIQASGGSIGVVIPPSIPMIIFGALTGASIGRLFMAGVFPGILMGLSIIAVAVFVLRSEPLERSEFSWRRLGASARDSMFALGAPVIILGGILSGVFTATESAAVAVVYALFGGFFIYRELKFTMLPQLFLNACITASVIMFIISQAQVFSWLLTIEEIPQTIASGLTGLTTNPFLLLLCVNAMLLIVGAFVETSAALILFVPVLMPMLPSLGIDLVQLGAIVVTNLAIGMLTPPLGICLIVSSSIAGSRIEETSKRILPFLAILIVDLLIITYWTPLTMFLPRVFIP